MQFGLITAFIERLLVVTITACSESSNSGMPSLSSMAHGLTTNSNCIPHTPDCTVVLIWSSSLLLAFTISHSYFRGLVETHDHIFLPDCPEQSRAVNCYWPPSRYSCSWFWAVRILAKFLFAPRPFMCLEMQPLLRQAEVWDFLNIHHICCTIFSTRVPALIQCPCKGICTYGHPSILSLYLEGYLESKHRLF
jgi:hypothetical protein